MEEQGSTTAYHSEGYELEGEGSLDHVEENETTVLFARLGDELQMLVQRYNVPPTDLEDLFQVVQHMFEIMDTDQMALTQAHREKQEIEDLWKQEKDKRKTSQRMKLDLECRLEEEELRRESERVELEKDKALLLTKVKHLEEHNVSSEYDLRRLKDKMKKNEEDRQELLERYKKQADMAKYMTLRRKKKGDTLLKKRTLPITPKTASIEQETPVLTPTRQLSVVNTGTADFLSTSLSHEDAEDEFSFQVPPPPHTHRTPSPLPSPPRSLADELEKVEEKNLTGQHINGNQNGNKTPRNGNQHGFDESLSSEMSSFEESGVGGGGGEWLAEKDGFIEEMMSVDPLVRTEVEMLQKDKKLWETEQKQLEAEKSKLREQKEAFERQNTQLQVELNRLQGSHKDLQEKLVVVKKERDEILDNYLEQPFDEYCITRKELHQLLVKQQITAFELEKAKEEKLQLQKELESRRTIFEKLRLKWKKIFSAKTTQESGEEMRMKERTSIPSETSLIPVVRDLSSVLSKGELVIEKDWLVSHDSQVKHSSLPHWMGQITMKGVETERIECSVVARIFQSPIKNLPPKVQVAEQKSAALLSRMQQLHAEVWVATVEASFAKIEIIDVIARPPKVRQRFVIKPKTAHVVCMKSIPGKIEESSEFVDSALLSHETEWMDCSFYSNRRTSTSSYLGPRVSFKGRDRPHSAPRERVNRNIMASTPNLCLSSASDPGPLNPDFFSASYSPDTPHKMRRLHDLQQQEQDYNTDTSSTCSLTTIDEDAGLEDTPPEPQLHNQHVEEQTTGQVVPAIKVDDAHTGCGDGEDEVDGGTGDDGEKEKGESAEALGPMTSTPTSKNTALWGGDRNRTKSTGHRYSSRRPKLEVDYDCTDSGANFNPLDEQSPVVWIVTEDNDLLFYPTTDPSHKPLNRVKLVERAICVEYVKEVCGERPRVFIGHAKSMISIYHMDEFQTHVWDIHNPERVTLPCANPNERHDVKCMAVVGDRIWVGAGPSIFFLNGENPSIREGSIFLDNYRRRPEQLLSLDDVVVVSTKGSVFYVFDAQSAHVVQKFDISHITHNLDQPITLNLDSGSQRVISAPTDIKAMVTDGNLLYLGTSNGKIVSVPIEALKQSQQRFVLSHSLEDTKPPRHEKEREKNSKHSRSDKKGKELKEKAKSTTKTSGDDDDFVVLTSDKDTRSLCLPLSAVAVHAHLDERVKDLLFLKLPEMSLTNLKQAAEMVHYHSLPNLASPYGGRIPVTPPVLSFRSLVISVGKGHSEYVHDDNREESTANANTTTATTTTEDSIHRERHEAFQLLVWGHKNMCF